MYKKFRSSLIKLGVLIISLSEIQLKKSKADRIEELIAKLIAICEHNWDFRLSR